MKNRSFLSGNVASMDSGTADFQPVKMLEVELSQPLCAVTATDQRNGRRYRQARVLVRLHTHPLGIVDLDLHEHGLSASEVSHRIWQELSDAINAHLRQDGLPASSGLNEGGLPGASVPQCLEARAHILAAAPLISVVVPTRDRTDQLAACLRSLETLEYPHYEIIVVDNAPATQATAELVQMRYGHCSHVRYVREERPGSSCARNCGLMHARGEIVAYTDDDVIVDRYWLTALAEAFQAANNVACVTGLTIPAELETSAQAWFEQFGGFNRGGNLRRQVFNLKDVAAHRTRDPLYPYTAGKFGASVNTAFKVPVLRAIGGFDPRLGAGSLAYASEDIDVFFRLLAKGYTLISEPAALIHHFHRRDYAGICTQLYRYGVGFTAFMTKCLIDDPRRIVDLASKLPYALYYLVSPRSPKHVKKQQDFPQELAWLELKGMLYGPLAYLRSHWSVR